MRRRGDNPRRRFLISDFQSGMLHSHDSGDCARKFLPSAALARQNALALRGQAVVAAAALIRFLEPAALDPVTLFRGDRAMGTARLRDGAIGTKVDETGDFVAVAGLVFELG